MPAAIRSTARSPLPPRRSSLTSLPISPTLRRPNTSDRIRSGSDAKKIVSLDPWGHLVGEAFREHLVRGYDIRPTHRGHARQYRHAGNPRGDRCRPHPRRRRHRSPRTAVVRVVKAAIDPVWYLPGIAERFGIDEDASCATDCTSRPAACIRSWSTRRDLKVFLPPIGGTTIYCFGDPAEARRRQHAAGLPRARRVQRLRRVRLRHLHLPAVSRARHRDCDPDGAGRRRRPRGLQPQGRPRARRGHQVPGLQRAQAPEGRRPARRLFQAHRLRRRRRRTCGSRS